MAKYVAFPGSQEARGAASSYIDAAGAYMDYDAGGNYAQFGGKGAGSIGVKIRNVIAGVATTLLTFGVTGLASFAFAMSAPGITSTSGLTVSSGSSVLQGVTATTLVTTGVAVFGAGTTRVADFNGGSDAEINLYAPTGGGGVDHRRWGIYNTGSDLVFRRLNDAYSAGTTWFTIANTGTITATSFLTGGGANGFTIGALSGANRIQWDGTSAFSFLNFGNGQAGITVASITQTGGTASLQAITGTTLVLSSTLAATTGTFTLNQNATTEVSLNNSDATNATSRSQFKTVSATVQGQFVAIAGTQVTFGSISNHPVTINTNGTTAITVATNQAVAFAAGATFASDVQVNAQLRASNNSSGGYASVLTNPNATGPRVLSLSMSGASPNDGSQDFIKAADSATTRFQVFSNGGISNFSANNINLSDERLKTGIRDLESVWDKHLAIRVVRAKYKDQTHADDNYMGLAQNIGGIFPELMDDADPARLGIYENDLNWITRSVVQECQRRIAALESRVAH